MKVLVTGFKAYDFKNTDGEQVKGCKISYLGNKPSVKSGEVGWTPMQVTCNSEILIDLKEVPGIYTAEFEMVPGKNNRPELAITGFNIVKPARLEELFK